MNRLQMEPLQVLDHGFHETPQGARYTTSRSTRLPNPASHPSRSTVSPAASAIRAACAHHESGGWQRSKGAPLLLH